MVYHSRSVAYRKLGQDAKADADKAKVCSMDIYLLPDCPGGPYSLETHPGR